MARDTPDVRQPPPDQDVPPLKRVNAPVRFVWDTGPDLVNLWAHRELLRNLVAKDLTVRYKDSLLGFVWTLIRPLALLLVYGIAVGQFLGAGRAIPQYGLYVFTGLLAWNLFLDILVSGTGSVVANASLLKKVYFPREVFPLSSTGTALVHAALQVVILMGAYVILGSWPDPTQLPLVPLAVVVLVIYSQALALVLSAANVWLRDIQYLVEIGVLFWFWMTPVVYAWTAVQSSLSSVPWLFEIYMVNPMTNVVLAFQRALWPAGAGTDFYYGGNLYARLGVLTAVGIALLWLAYRVFAKAQGSFAQEL